MFHVKRQKLSVELGTAIKPNKVSSVLKFLIICCWCFHCVADEEPTATKKPKPDAEPAADKTVSGKVNQSRLVIMCKLCVHGLSSPGGVPSIVCVNRRPLLPHLRLMKVSPSFLLTF